MEKEARKEERRRRRNRSKFRDPFAVSAGAPANLVTRGARRSSNPDITTLQELTPNPAPAPAPLAVKDSCTKLIIEDDQQEAGPSGARKASDVRKHIKIRKRSEDKLPPPVRKRSGNPDLPVPPIPSGQHDPRLDNKKRRRDSDQQNPRPPTGLPEPQKERRPIQKPVPLVQGPPVVEERRRRNPRPDHERRKRRSKSRDVNLEPYTGPVIVEIESTTHDGPPPTDPVIESIVTVDESPAAALLDEVQQPAVEEIKINEIEVNGSRKNSKEQVVVGTPKDNVIVLTE